jgi:hypothetical protein
MTYERPSKECDTKLLQYNSIILLCYDYYSAFRLHKILDGFPGVLNNTRNKRYSKYSRPIPDSFLKLTISVHGFGEANPFFILNVTMINKRYQVTFL